MEREKGKGNGERRDREGKRVRELKREERASSPLYSESGIPGCCQVTVGQSLEEMQQLLLAGDSFQVSGRTLCPLPLSVLRPPLA